jgi:hypothetical protein
MSCRSLFGVAFPGKDAAVPGETRLNPKPHRDSERYLSHRMADE